MNKADALKKIIEDRKEKDARDFTNKVEALVWDIETASEKLRELKKQLTELTFTETPIPDISDCIEED